MEELSISPITNQIVTKKLAMYASTHMGNEIVYLVQAIYILIHEIGEEKIKEWWIEQNPDSEWSEIMKKLQKSDKIARKVKVLYDRLSDKRFENKDKELDNKKEMMKYSSRISAINFDMIGLLLLIINHTSLKRRTIPAEDFKILEHQKMKVFEITKGNINKPTGDIGGNI